MFALLQHPTSWVMFNLAALYWRVEGRASRALNCLTGALHFSPRDKKVSQLFIYEPSGLLLKVKLWVMQRCTGV